MPGSRHLIQQLQTPFANKRTTALAPSDKVDHKDASAFQFGELEFFATADRGIGIVGEGLFVVWF